MSSSQQFEVEQKFALGDRRAEIELSLQQLGAALVSNQSQADRYFNHPQRDFAQTDEALRIRSVGAENWLTYKGPKIDSRTKTRREIEPELGAGEHTVDQLAEVLTILGFRSVATVKKQRRSYELKRGDWLITIALDEVEQLGSYLEIELVTDAAQLAAAQQTVINLAAELGLLEPERRSYLRMLLLKLSPS
jgi:adenylate cyclase class 2